MDIKAYVTCDYFERHEELFEDFLCLAAVRNYKEGDILVSQGGEFPGFYLLLDGILETSTRNENGLRKVLCLMYPRNLLGFSCIDQRPSMLEYTCMTPVRAGILPKDSISKWSDEMLLFFAQMQTWKSKGLQKQVEYSKYYATEERALLILQEFECQMRAFQKCGNVPTGMKKQLLADFLGITNVHLSNVIAKLEKRGSISSSRSLLFLKGDGNEKML